MSAQWRYLKWRAYKANRRLRQVFYSRLYRDKNQDINKSILIAGTARSGTTWLADIVSSQLNGRILFEPFDSRYVQAYSKFQYYQYMRPTEQNELLLSYCHDIFTGAIRNPWIDQQVESLTPVYRVIKAVRANLFLRWIRDEFPEIPILFIMRHPCAVVSSWINLTWTAETDIEYLLAQPKLVDDFLLDKNDVIRGAEHPEERQAIIWCVNNLIPLKQLRGNSIHIVFYENLCLFPEAETTAVFNAINQPFDDVVLSTLSRPSITSNSSSAFASGEYLVERWRSELSRKQIQRIERIVSAFGLDHIYGDSSVPQIDPQLVFDG